MAEEDEIEKLKEERMQELEEGSEDLEDGVEQQREQIKNLAAQYLTSEARSRLGNIRAADPDLASAIETQIAQLGRMGQIDEMDDDELKEILKEVRSSEEDTDIKFRR